MSGKVITREQAVNSKGYQSGQVVTRAEAMYRDNAITATNKAKSVIDSYNSFVTAVEADTSGDNIFNASDFFEERKKQAEALKQRAADLAEYMSTHQDFYTQESYDELVGILATFDTNVDDVMSRYQPSLDSKAGMAAYEDEYIAAMEQNAQLRQNQQAATFGVDPMYQNMGIFDGFFRQSTDNSKQAVTDNWTAEQRYNLGFYQNEDPAKARKYAELVNAGQDPLVSKQQEAEKASMMAIDLDSEKREIDRMKADLENYSWNTEFDATSSSERKAFNEEIKRREKEITEREKIYNQAKRLQDSEKFASVTENEDFAVNSGYSSGVDTSIFDQPYGFDDLGQDALTYEYINNPDNVRSKIDQNDTSFSAKGYDQLTEEEVGIYNYYYATEGPEKAQQYLDNIQETLSYRMGKRIAQSKSGDLWKQYLSAAITGYGGAVSGIQNLFNDDEYIPATAFQQAYGMIREDLADVGKMPEFYGDTSLGQIGYDLISTTANMVPSIAASSLFGPVAGAVTMGASSAGNAYQEALNSGYSKEQARTYAALTGASEAGLDYVLGGISKLGGEIPQQIIKNMIRGVDNAVARAAITLGGSMVSEGFEEGLQEVITPWIENLTLYTDKDVNWDEVAYSTLLGALSGGFMEGPGVVVNTANVSSVEKQLKSLGAKGNTLELAELIVKQKSGEQLSQDEYIKLVKNEPAMKILKGQIVKTEDTGETVSESAPVEKPKVSSDGKAIQISTNETIEALDFASLNKGKATIQLKSGDTAEYSDVSFASEAQANQFYAAASLPGIDTENANNLLHTIQDADAGKDVDSVVGIREAYGIGYFGMQESDLENGDAGKLSPELRKAVFDIGRQQRAADAMVKATAKPVTAKASPGYKKVVFEGKTRKITKKQKAEIDFVDYIAENFSGNTVHVFESYKGRDGKYYYRDNNGKVHRAPNGKYVNGEIWLDLKSGDNQEGLMLNTFAHEMYHHIEKFDKAKAQELAEFVVKELGKKSVDDAVAEQIKKARKAGLGESYFQSRGMTAEQARNEVYMRAMSDFVADSLETMFTRGDPAKAIANLKQENRTLFDEIKAFIDKWVSKLKEFYSDKTISKEGELVAQLEKFEQLQQLFMEGVQSAGENYRAALSELTPGEAGEIVNADGDPVAMSTDDGSVMLSIRTYEEDGRSVFRNYLDKCVTSNRLTAQEAKEMRDGIEEIYNVCKEFKDKYAPFSTWSDAEVIRDTRGRPVFSVVTPNGDYKMNLDFSLVCKKRRTLDAVFNEMSRRGIIDDFELGQKSVVKINEIIRKHGLETACALCFVDAKRFRQASMADSFTRLYNELVESLVPEDQKGNIDHFNFSGYETIKKVDGGIDTWDNSQLDFSYLDDVMKRYGKGTVEHKTAKYIKSSPEARKLLLRGDFMSSQGFDAVKTRNKDILKLYNSKKCTGGPKAAFGDVQYLNEIIRKERTWTPSKAYEVGGIRIQSFSDYVPRMVFDYTQMIYDLAARKLPAHAYTKESLFVKQFGLTGVKINMSLIPAVAKGGIAPGLDAKGNYVWAGESFNYDEAVEIQNAEGYTENCGTICVGVSNKHIEKLLRDPNIRMVIPYHKSGLNPIVAHMNKIAEFTDYTNDQRTKGKDGKAISKEFNFNEAVKRTGDPKAAAKEYLKWCKDSGYTPKFNDFAKEENYYKLLEDFTLYDKDGKYVPQREVRAAFPTEGSAFGTMKDLIKAGLEEDAVVEGKRDKNLSSIVDEIQNTLPKTEAEISEEQVAQADRDLEAYSLRNEKSGKKESGKSYKTEQKDLIQKMQTEQRLIREELTGKKSDISIMEKEFIRLAKQYERLDTKTGKKSAKDARAITQLRTALKEEAKSHRDDSKIWEREFNRLLRDYDTAGRQIDRLEATIARQRATAKARVEGRRKTEMRHKIQRKANELNHLLLHGTKHRNVPESMQPAVASILKAINMEVRDGEQRRATYEATLARYDRQIAMTSNPAEVSRLIEKRNEYAAKGDQFANKMAELKAAYEEIQDNKIPNLEIDEGLSSRLMELFVIVGDTPLGQMTAEQLEAVNDVLEITKATVRNANQMLAEARAAGVVETSKSAITEIKSAGETKKTKTRFRKVLEQFGWNNLKPEYAIEVIGSKTLKARYDALRKGEDTLAADLNEAKKFVQEQWKKNGGKDWDMDQKFTFTSTSGKSFELNLDQIMNLYALAKDKDARSHLRVGGFAFDSDYQTKKRGPLNIPIKVESTDASAYNLSDEILGEIISKLSPEQRAFADAMQAYLSDTMAAKGNEVSLKKYGIRLFKKKDYFPIRVADQFMAKAREQQAGDRKLKDAGFTKDRKPEAKNPVVLSGFMKTWAEHVDEMSLYHSFVLPLDDFNRVLNYHDAFVEGEQASSVVEAITNAFGDGAVKYLDQLIKDVNGGIKGGSTVSFASRMMSKAKKAQTMASLSVAIQQPSSIIRAMSEVDSKYFLGPKVTEKTHDRTWNEIKEHAPIAIIKEMGGYDTNVGKSTVDYLTDTAEYNGFGEKFKAMFTDEKFRDDFLGRLPALMDEMSWGVIWNAVKREQSDLHPGMDVKSDAFMKMVANRFTEVITRTQVYDSVFSRSGLMRDRKSDLAKMTTSFMAEPTTTANMLAVSILRAKRGDIPKKQAVKTTASIVASLALNAALVSVVYAMRDDDEDKRYGEKWIENFYSNFFESLNPIEYIPYVRDIYNVVVKGYDVERADMELFGDLENALSGLYSDDLSAWDKTENVVGAIGNLVGIPLKNILRDSRGVAKTIAIALDEESKDRSTKTGKYMARRGMDLSDGEEMILALQRGDEEHIQRVFGRYESQQEAERVLQSAIGEQYKNGDLTREEAEKLLRENFDREDEHEVYWILDKWDYAIENGNSEGYAKYGKLYEAIESGEYEAEIDRLMENGVEASDIRSGITKKYHKAYLEGDETTRKEIRDDIIPVYEAAGMDAEEIGDKFRDWDFEAEYGMSYSEMKAEYRNGDVTENEMRNAMKFYGLKNFEIEENMRSLNDDIAFVNQYDMTLSEMKDAYDDGDVTRNQMTNALVFTGMTQNEAKKWVTQRDIENRYGIDYAKLDDAYKHNDISRTDLYNAMIQNGATKQEADDAILGYDWLKKNVKKYPDLSISDAKKFAVRISADQPDYTLEDFGVKVDDYIQYSKLRPDCKGVDNNGDGQADSGTKRDAIFKMIDSLPISSDAKDGLALIDYGFKSIRKNAPWHK